MPRYLIDGMVLTLTAEGGARWRAAGSSPPPPPPPPPPEGLTPSWTVEYVDTSGVLQRTIVANDGSTSITVRQYANITFDGRASRSTSTGCNTAAGAAQLMGFGVNYGEALGDAWGTSGLSRDKDNGPPIFSRCYTVAGARAPVLYLRDPDGRESAVGLTINVQALGSVTDISAGGSWPAWVSGTVYGLSSGDYSARGPIETPGRYGIRIVKIGGGADPVVDEFRPESRGIGHGSLITDRSRDVVLVGIDYARIANGVVNSDYCGSYGGHCRGFGEGTTFSLRYVWENDGINVGNQINADNVRYARGTFVVNGGNVDSVTGGIPNYCFLAGGRSFNFAGTTFRRTAGDGGGNPMRTYLDSTVLRHVGVQSTSETIGWLKGSMMPLVYSTEPTDPWPDDDSFGDYATSRARFLSYGDGYQGNWSVGPSYFWVLDCVFGGAGGWPVSYVGGWNPQNNDSPGSAPYANERCYEAGRIGGFERNHVAQSGTPQLTVSGQDISYRGNTYQDGSPWNVTPNSNPVRTAPTCLGPYHTGARPVHSALVEV